MPLLSRGDFLGDSHHSRSILLSPHRSSSPTGEHLLILCIKTGGFFLSQLLYDSYPLPFFSESNCIFKPPWISTYKSHIFAPFLFLTLPFSVGRYPNRKMSDNLRKNVQDLNLGIDDEPVSIPRDFCSQAASVNRYSLVVTAINPRKQNIRALMGQMPKVWGFPDSCVGRNLGNGRVQFKFQSEEAMNLVLRRGPWSFNDWVLSTHRWYPNISEAEMKIIPFWVRIEGIPMLYLTNAMAEFVGSRLGPVTDVDFDENAHHVGFVRVRIDWNYDNPLRFQRNIQFGENENTIIKFKFERLRNFCSKCGSLKHDIKECTLHFADEEPDEDSESDDDNDNHRFENEQEMSDANTLQTVNPVTLIPGLQTYMPSANTGLPASDSDDVSLPSVFEDTELTAERLRYIHAKYTRNMDKAIAEANLLERETDNAQDQFVFKKRNRVSFETMYRKAEAADELAVMCHLRKRGKRTESSGSCAKNHGIDRGAGGPVPPQFPI